MIQGNCKSFMVDDWCCCCWPVAAVFAVQLPHRIFDFILADCVVSVPFVIKVKDGSSLHGCVHSLHDLEFMNVLLGGS